MFFVYFDAKQWICIVFCVYFHAQQWICIVFFVYFHAKQWICNVILQWEFKPGLHPLANAVRCSFWPRLETSQFLTKIWPRFWSRLETSHEIFNQNLTQLLTQIRNLPFLTKIWPIHSKSEKIGGVYSWAQKNGGKVCKWRQQKFATRIRKSWNLLDFLGFWTLKFVHLQLESKN